MDGAEGRIGKARRQIWWMTKKLDTSARYANSIPDGWVRTLRVALGMSNQNFAKRLGITPASVSALEASEARGSVRIETLRRAAAALGCDLTYSFVPSQKLSEALEIVDAHSPSHFEETAEDQFEDLVDAYLRAGLGPIDEGPGG